MSTTNAIPTPVDLDGDRQTADAHVASAPAAVATSADSHSAAIAVATPAVFLSDSANSDTRTASGIPCAQASPNVVDSPPEGASGPSAEIAATGRGANGRFTPGNTAALKHGGRSEQVRSAMLPEQAEVRAALAARRQEIENDLGGPEALSRLSADMVGRYIELSVVADWLGGRLVAEGPLTAKGRQRAALTAYLSVVDRLHRLATALGLERRQKPVNAVEAIHRAAIAAEARSSDKGAS